MDCDDTVQEFVSGQWSVVQYVLLIQEESYSTLALLWSTSAPQGVESFV